jgi:hypothetical protein
VIGSVLTLGYGAFSSVGFVPTLGYGTNAIPTVVTVDTHDGFDGKKGKHERKKRETERLHNQLEQAFRSAFAEKPQVIAAKPQVRNDVKPVPYVFPAYVEEYDETEELMLLMQ